MVFELFGSFFVVCVYDPKLQQNRSQQYLKGMQSCVFSGQRKLMVMCFFRSTKTYGQCVCQSKSMWTTGSFFHSEEM